MPSQSFFLIGFEVANLSFNCLQVSLSLLCWVLKKLGPPCLENGITCLLLIHLPLHILNVYIKVGHHTLCSCSWTSCRYSHHVYVGLNLIIISNLKITIRASFNEYSYLFQEVLVWRVITGSGNTGYAF